METWQSWTIFGLATAGAIFYYTASPGQKRRGAGRKLFNAQDKTKKNEYRASAGSRDGRNSDQIVNGSKRTSIDDTATASIVSASIGGSESARRKSGGRKSPQGLRPMKSQNSGDDLRTHLSNGGSVKSSRGLEGDPENEGMSNAEFAKQLNDRIVGSSLQKTEVAPSKKARRQARRATETSLLSPESLDNAHDLSRATSTSGADADDERSSDPFASVQGTNAAPMANDVSDMIEVPIKGPSVLRVVESNRPQIPRPQRPSRAAPAEPESKKQRQRRRKKEEQRVLRDEAERERHALMEKQRQTAREAEGRPARNGQASLAAVTNQVWNRGPSRDTDASRPSIHGVSAGLLDTFDDSTSSSNALRSTASSETPASSVDNYNGLPSEEEQMKLVNQIENDGAWSTVSKNGKAKAKPSAIVRNGTAPRDSSAEAQYQNARKDNGAQQAAGENFSRQPPDASSFPQGATATALNAQVNGLVSGRAAAPSSKARNGIAQTMIDRSVWNRANIHQHPSYDAAYPYALTGHPDDSDWAVV